MKKLAWMWVTAGTLGFVAWGHTSARGPPTLPRSNRPPWHPRSRTRKVDPGRPARSPTSGETGHPARCARNKWGRPPVPTTSISRPVCPRRRPRDLAAGLLGPDAARLGMGPGAWVRRSDGWTYREGQWVRTEPDLAPPGPPRRHVVARPSPGPAGPFTTPDGDAQRRTAPARRTPRPTWHRSPMRTRSRPRTGASPASRDDPGARSEPRQTR